MHTALNAVRSFFTYPTALGPVWSIFLTLIGLPLANEIVQRAKGTRAQTLLQGIALALLRLPYVGAMIVKFPVVGELLYVFAPRDKVGLPKPLLQLAIDAKRPGPPPSGALAFACMALIFSAGCGFCQVPENRTTPRCIAQGVVTDCGAPEVVKIVVDIVASVGQALASADFSNLLSAIEVDLKNRGVADIWGVITCAIHRVGGKYSASATDNPTVAHGKQWIAEHPARVKNTSGGGGR